MTSAHAQLEPTSMPEQAIDSRELRKALSTFMTGVTMITTIDAEKKRSLALFIDEVIPAFADARPAAAGQQGG